MKKDLDKMTIMPPTMRILPVEGIIPLPHIIFPVMIREENLLQLINDALKTDKTIAVFTRIINDEMDEDDNEIFEIGVACSILKIIQTGDGSSRVLLRGLHRIKIDRDLETQLEYRIAIVKKLDEVVAPKLKAEAYIRTISDLFQRIISISS